VQLKAVTFWVIAAKATAIARVEVENSMTRKRLSNWILSLEQGLNQAGKKRRRKKENI
jgi:hypothetical protein